MKLHMNAILGGVAILGLFLVVWLCSLYLHRTEIPSHTNSPRVVSTTNTFCDCYLLTDTSIINAKTGIAQPRLPEISAQLIPVVTYLSPTRRHEVVLTQDRQSAYVITYPSLSIVHLYSAPEGRQLGGIVWSADEQHVAIEIHDPQTLTTDGSESRTTSVVLVDVTTGQSSLFLDVTNKVPTAKDGFALMWISNDLQHFVYVTGSLTTSVNWFRSDDRKITDIKENISGAIYMRVAYAKDAKGIEKDEILWVDGQGLHGYDLTKKTTVTYTDMLWSDSPVSPPSPDGESVIYFKKVKDQEAGVLTRLNLRTREETVLSPSPMTEAFDLNQAVWSPDGAKVLLNALYPTQEIGWISSHGPSQFTRVQNEHLGPINDGVRAAIAK